MLLAMTSEKRFAATMTVVEKWFAATDLKGEQAFHFYLRNHLTLFINEFKIM
jgi:hypothetical protein